MQVPWDFVELPALLNERWIEDMALMRRHLTHWRTGEPIPEDLIDGVLAAARHDRVFSVTLDYLAGAIIDLRLHRTEHGEVPDPELVERDVLARIGMPRAVDQTMRPPHFYHIFSEAYAAGVYSYLLGDVMAADVAESFLEATGGLYDPAVAASWRDTLLSTGTSEPVDEAYRRFRGRDPEPDALFRRFGIAA
jgi:peptidyl-dipeptidase Dcp